MIGTVPVYSMTAPKALKARAEKMGLTCPFQIVIKDFRDWPINPLKSGHSRIDHLTSSFLPGGAIMLVSKTRSDGHIQGFTDSATLFILEQVYTKTSDNYYVGSALVVPLEDFKEKFKIHKSPLRR